MTCPHATTTTIAWLYGEASDAHTEHVADCAECTAVCAEHESVMSEVMPAMPRGLPAGPREAPARRRDPAPWVFGALAAAAVALVVLRAGPLSTTPPITSAVAPVDVVAMADAVPSSMWSGELNDDLADLDASLDALADALSTL